MGASASKNDAEQSNHADFSQSVFNPAAMQNMQGQFNNLFGNTMGGMQNLTPDATQQMQDIYSQTMPNWQNQMGGGAYQGMDLQNQYNQALQGGGNERFVDEQVMGGAGNDYVDAMKGSMQQDFNKRLGSNLSMLDQRAASGELGGSSRHGLAQAKMFDDSNRALTDAQTSLGFTSFDKNLDRMTGIAQRADQFDMGKMQNISGMMGQQQQAMQGGLSYGQGMQNLGMGQFAPYMAPWQMSGQYANNLGRPTVLGSGSSSSSSESDSMGGGFGF